MPQGMQNMGIDPDFSYENLPGHERPELCWYQRSTDNEEIWFVSNQDSHKAEALASFQGTGLQPEWWDPVDGSTRNLPEFRVENGRTIVPLTFEPLQSGFVVFRREAEQEGQEGETNFHGLEPLMDISGSWNVYSEYLNPAPFPKA